MPPGLGCTPPAANRPADRQRYDVSLEDMDTSTECSSPRCTPTIGGVQTWSGAFCALGRTWCEYPAMTFAFMEW